MKTARVFLVAMALACGGSNNSGSVDPAMGGTWTGTTTLTVSGQSESENGQLVIAVSGQDATFSQVCLDGSGSVTAHGSGRSVSWTGTYACAPVSFTNCPSVILTYQTASATLNGSTLSAQGSGTAAGCGSNTTFAITFTGTK